MRNGDTSPQPVYTTVAQEWQYFYKLPRRLRLALVECRYEYNSKMVYDTWKQIQFEHFMSPDQAEEEMIHQMLLNDQHLIKQEMEKKWNGQMPPLTKQSKPALNWRTKRTASTASRSEIHHFVRGTKPQKISAVPQGTAFDLFGTALRPLSKATKTG